MRPILYPLACALELLMLLAALLCIVFLSIAGPMTKWAMVAVDWLLAKAQSMPGPSWYICQNDEKVGP